MAATTSIADVPRTVLRPLRAYTGVWRFLRPHRALLIWATLALLVSVVITLSIPIAVRGIIEGLGNSDAELLNAHFGIAAGVALLAAVGFSIRFYLVKLLGELTVADVRKEIFARMIRMSPSYFEHVLTGEVISRITSDTMLLLNAIGWSFSAILRHVLVLIGGLLMLAAVSVKLTLLVLSVVPLAVIPVFLLGRRLRTQSRISQERVAESTGVASESLSAAQTVQVFTNEPLRTALFDDISTKAFHAARNVVKAHVTMNGAVIFLTLASVIGVVWVGANDVHNGAMTGGELAQFILFAMLVAEAANGLTNSWGEVQRAAGAVERIVELLDAQDLIVDPVQTRGFDGRARGTITFENVSFSYPSSSAKPALDSIDLQIKAGEVVALVGPSGAGKSTILQLLLRFYDPTFGRILLDGIDLRDMKRSDFRQHFGFVPQDPVVFAASARDNLRFGSWEVAQKDIEAAAQVAAAHGFLSDLPEGFDTFLGERGTMLSGGQKQRIAIARAILRDAPVLLLDEATSALDVESEKAIQKAIDHMSRDRTTIIIAHRLSTVKQADRILVFDEGRLVAQGSHEALIAQGGLYAPACQTAILCRA